MTHLTLPRIVASPRLIGAIAFALTLLWSATSATQVVDLDEITVDADGGATEGGGPRTFAPDIDRPLELAVSLESLSLASQNNGLAIAYTVAPRDWQRIQEADLTLWFSVYVPNQTTPITFAYSYHLPLEQRAGVVSYPDWLSTLSADEIGVCLLGTRPYDKLSLGRGYICSELLVTPIADTLDENAPPVTFQLLYYDGLSFFGYWPYRTFVR